MEMAKFVEKTIKDLVGAVEKASNDLDRDIYIAGMHDKGSIEFDIAVTIEINTEGNAEIAVIPSFLKGKIDGALKHGEINRIKFSAFVSSKSRKQEEEQKMALEERYNKCMRCY